MARSQHTALRFAAALGAIVTGSIIAEPAGTAGATPVWEPAEEVAIDTSLTSAWTYAGFGGLDCVTPDDCVAVGTAGWPSVGAFVATKSGGTWSDAIQVPDGNSIHDDTDGGGADVHCVSAGNCVIVGSYSPSGAAYSYELSGMTATMVDGTWGDMTLIPGTDNFQDNGTRPRAEAFSVSCSPDGATCVLGGSFRYGATRNLYSGFVAALGSGSSWSARTWGTATEVPGLSALNTDNAALVTRVDCPAANSCVAIGTVDVGAKTNGYITEFDGTTWSNAAIVPGLDALNGNAASFEGLDCASDGECVVAGRYWDSAASQYQGFVAVQSNGTWGNAIAIPGLAALRTGSTDNRDPWVRSVSCPAAGECAVTGNYIDSAGTRQAFIVEQDSGTWGTAQKLNWSTDLATAAAGADSTPTLDCPAAGECVVTGTYRATTPSTVYGAYVAMQSGGTWGDLIALPGTSGLNATRTNGNAVDCTAAGTCMIAGTFMPGYKLYASSVASPPPSTVPDPPTALSATAGDTTIDIAFTVGADGGSPLTNHEYSIDGGTNWVPFAPARLTSPATISGLTNDTAYTVTIRAVNANGPSVASASVTATPTAPTTTSPPSSAPTTTAPEATTTVPASAPPTTSPTTTTPDDEISTAGPAPVPLPDGKLPDLDPSIELVMIDGIPTPATVTIEENTRVRLSQGPSSLALTAIDEDGAPKSIDALGRLVIDEEGRLEVTGTGFEPDSTVHLWVFSEPAYLGSVIVGADGTFRAEVAIPDTLPAGLHTVQANGITAEGSQMSTSLGVVVESTGLLPSTGAGTITDPLILAAALGGLTILASRRRHL